MKNEKRTWHIKTFPNFHFIWKPKLISFFFCVFTTISFWILSRIINEMRRCWFLSFCFSVFYLFKESLKLRAPSSIINIHISNDLYCTHQTPFTIHHTQSHNEKNDRKFNSFTSIDYSRELFRWLLNVECLWSYVIFARNMNRTLKRLRTEWNWLLVVLFHYFR